MSGSPEIVVFDLDGTLSRRDTYVAYLGGYLWRNPRRIWRTLHLPLAILVQMLGLRDRKWLKEAFLAAVLGGAERPKIETWTERFTDMLLKNGLRPGAVFELQRHRLKGSRRVLATAGLDIYANKIGEALGFDDVICTRVAWRKDGKLAGTLEGPNCRGVEKLRQVKQLLQAHNRACVDVAYSDSHADLPLLQFAKTGVAVNSTMRLTAIARRSGLRTVDWNRNQ